MKDSFGGSIMIYIIIFFLGIYIVFIALTLRYAQAFKLKNKTIDLIEQYDGNINSDFEDELTEYFQKNKGLDPTSLKIRFDLGMEDGKSKTRSKTFSNVRTTATSQDLFDVANSIANLQTYDVLEIIKQDYTSLNE